MYDHFCRLLGFKYTRQGDKQMHESQYNLPILQCQLDSNICTESCTCTPHAIMAWTDNLTSHITIR